MTDHAELRRLAKAATPGPWTLYVPEDYQGPDELPGYGVECAEGRAIVWGALEPETGCQFDRDAEFIAAANPQAILAMLDEIDRLRSRLEIDERTPHDGIACRDETIKVLDEKCDRLKAENEVLRGALHAVQAEVDGNLRPLTRDLVNMVSGLNNGTHPNDIYDHCDEIERIIGAALEGATK
ncbi:TPA: ead/Ea22-like family protein [Pseudomonas aeruginosa]